MVASPRKTRRSSVSPRKSHRSSVSPHKGRSPVSKGSRGSTHCKKRCKATTIKGTRCKACAMSGSDYCYVHQPRSPTRRMQRRVVKAQTKKTAGYKNYNDLKRHVDNQCAELGKLSHELKRLNKLSPKEMTPAMKRKKTMLTSKFRNENKEAADLIRSTHPRMWKRLSLSCRRSFLEEGGNRHDFTGEL